MKRLTLGKLVLTLLALLTLLAGAAWLALVVGVSVDVQGNHHLTLINLGAREDLEIFWLTRLPRAIAAGIAGAGLAAAGTTFQAVLRNPLAEPFTLGVSSGAALGAVLAIHLGLETTVLGGNAVPLMAFIGALASVVMVWRVARVGSSRPPAMLLLAGVTFAFLCSAASMLVQYTATFSESYQILHWMSGGLTWVPYVDLVRSGSVVGLGLAVLIYLARDLNALAAGSEAAASVGVSVERVVAVAYIAASLVVGAVIAFAGPIGFVGIVVPHALRAIIGPDHRLLLPASILGGAAFVMVSDLAARTLIAPRQLPVGILTALIGGVFFLTLLVREKGGARLWGA